MKKETQTISIIILFVVLTFCGCINDNVVVEQKMVYVDDDGDANYTQIQNAIDNASNGVNIFVKEGIYNESLIIDKTINLFGEGTDKTIIQPVIGSSLVENSIIYISEKNSSIKDCKIIGFNTDAKIIGININSTNASVLNNVIMFVDQGIYLNEDSIDNKIIGNSISNCLEGVSGKNTDSNDISKNSISFSRLYGIYLLGSDNNIISENTVSNNSRYAMRIKGSKHNTVHSNLITNNQEGIYLCCGSVSNTVYNNYLKQNTVWNANDAGTNKWDNGIIGNYWDDYSGRDEDGDGLGDIPYIMEGVKGSKDNYPLMSYDIN